jgi:hypothetical protein
MVRNTDALMRSSRLRSEDATKRATAAILLMQAEEVDINFRSVAARAKVSTVWLYGNKVRPGKDCEDPQYIAGCCGREPATPAAALPPTSRRDSPTPHSVLRGNQSRAERAAPSRLRQACGGTAKSGSLHQTPESCIKALGASSNLRRATFLPRPRRVALFTNQRLTVGRSLGTFAVGTFHGW